jgi:hypothetical protein
MKSFGSKLCAGEAGTTEQVFLERHKPDSCQKITRRSLIHQTALTALGLGLPFVGDVALAQPQRRVSRDAPFIRFKRSIRGGAIVGPLGSEGVVGPFGEVFVQRMGDETLPVLVAAADDSAVMDLTARSTFVRYGKGANAITLRSNGVKFGAAKEESWSPATIAKLISVLARDRNKARGALLLRSALQTSYPVAAAWSKAPERKQTRMGSTMSKSAAGYGYNALTCTTRTVTETVTRTITETVEIIKTAEQQYQECYDREASRDPCKSAIFVGVCAAGICALTAFVDLVVGFVEVVTTIAEEVTREVVTCVTPKPGEWPTPWTIADGPIRTVVPQEKIVFGQKEIQDALALLASIPGLLGPFGACFFQGQWSLAQVDTQLNLGGTDVVIPYGVKVCLSAECATQLSIDELWNATLGGWASALAVLAALNKGAAASLAAIGIVPSPAVAAIIAGIPAGVVVGVTTAATIILLFILIALMWGTAISSQLWCHKTFTDNFADGTVCLDHPSFAIPLVGLLTLGIVPAWLTPPIVTG